MQSPSVPWRWWLLSVSLVLATGPAALAGGESTARTLTPAEKCRAALDQHLTLDYTSQNIQEAVNDLSKKLKVSIVLDTQVLQLMGIGIDENTPTPVHLKSKNDKVRTALQRMLDPYQLTYVILGETVLITTEDVAHYRQMRQRVDVNVEGVPIREALRRLGRDTGTTLVLDPRSNKEGDTKVSLQMEDVTLETAVRLLSLAAGLDAVPVGNALFITGEDRAARLAAQKQTPPPALLGGPGADAMPGINGLVPPALRLMPGRVGGFGAVPVAPPVAPAPAPPVEKKATEPPPPAPARY